MFRASYFGFRAWPLVVCGLLTAINLSASDQERTDAPASETLKQLPKPNAPALPWEPPPRVSEPILRPPASAREVLERYQIGPSQVEGFFSGQPLSPSEEDVVVKVLYRLPRLGLENLQRWRQTKVTWDQLAAAPTEHRVEVFPVRGRARRVERHPLLPEQAELFEMTHFYRVTLDLADSPYQAVLLARRIPEAWPIDQPLDEPAAADALFLKLGDSLAENPPLYFACGRVAWLPDRTSTEKQVNAGQVALARLGMDAGQWELVRQTNARGIVDEDREAFYQLLAAVGRREASGLKAAENAQLNVAPLLQHTAEYQGEILPVQGVALRVLKVPVSDVDVRARFGIDHYYEIHMSVSLGNVRVSIPRAEKDQPPAVYQNDLPATLLVRRLPAGLAEGERLHQVIRADGVFFKIWSYKSAYAAKFKQSQPALLFVATEPVVVQTDSPSNWVVTSLVFAAFALALSVVAVITWWQRVSDRPQPAQPPTLPKPPDFSKLT